MDVIEESKKYALSEIKKFGTPIPIHFEISEKKAIELADKLKADKKIVQVGVFLMDLKLGQALRKNKLSEHVQMSVEATKHFLKEFDLDEEFKDKIINCVEAHHRNVPFKCIEAEICANADCYRFLHPKGFFAYWALLGTRYSDFTDCLNQVEKKMEEKYKILSLDICKDELSGFYNNFRELIDIVKNF